MSLAPLIYETIVTTQGADGRPHIVPLGIRREAEKIILMPFRPSSTLENILVNRQAVVNHTDDVRVFAGCLTGRRDWPTLPACKVPVARLANCLSHLELQLDRIEDDPVRPRLLFRQVHAETHGSFCGFNRAQAAVIEACILASRLSMLPEEKVRQEIAFHTIAMEKTAGPREWEAWSWLMEKIDASYSAQPHCR